MRLLTNTLRRVLGDPSATFLACAVTSAARMFAQSREQDERQVMLYVLRRIGLHDCHSLGPRRVTDFELALLDGAQQALFCTQAKSQPRSHS